MKNILRSPTQNIMFELKKKKPVIEDRIKTNKKQSTLYQTTNILDWSKLKAFADDKINLT